jgi:hypothetical protein
MKYLILVIVFLMIFSIVSEVPANSAFEPDSTAPPALSVTSHIGHEILYLPENSSNLDMFYIWNITIFQNKAFTISVYGITVSTGAGPISISENVSKYTEVNVTIKIGSTTYSYSDISIIGVPPQIGIYNVIVTSTYPGQDQTLAVKQGVSGQLTYPKWNILLESSNNESYSIYDNGLLINSGHVLGSKNIDLNITGNTTSVIISLGTHIFNYKNELVAHIPISQYYKPKPPPLVATALDVAISFVRGIVIVFLAILSGMMLSRRYIMAKKDMEPQRRW